MGAWGVDPFENDGALEVLSEVKSEDFSFDDFEWAFDDPDYLEVDGGQIAIALSALVDMADAGGGSEELAAGKDNFASQLTPDRRSWIHDQLNRALSDSDRSEIYELWKETDQFEAWLAASRSRGHR